MEVEKNDRLVSLNGEIQKANRLRYEVSIQFANCRQLRETLYGYVKKYRSYLSSCCSNITPVHIVIKENTFEPLSLFVPGEQELDRYEEYIESISNHASLMNCFYRCLIEVKRSFRECLATWELLSSYFETVGLGVYYKEGKDTSFLEEMEVTYTPAVSGFGGPTEQRFEKCIYHIMQVKKLSDELLYAPLLQKKPEENTKFDRIELLQILNRLLCERGKLEAVAILPVKEPTEKMNPSLFTKDELYDEFIYAWED